MLNTSNAGSQSISLMPHLRFAASWAAVTASAVLMCVSLPKQGLCAEPELVLSNAVLKAHLGRDQRGVLDLNRYTSLAKDVDANLLKSYEGVLLLNSLEEFPSQLRTGDFWITDKVQRGVAALQLNGLSTLRWQDAAGIQKCIRVGGSVHLDGLKTLNVDTARMLCGGNTPKDAVSGTVFDFSRLRTLSLSGLAELKPPNVAKELARVKGTLVLNGVTTLPEKVAEILSGHGTDEENAPGGDLYLQGLEKISERSLSLLLSKDGAGDLYLDGLQEIAPDPAFGTKALGFRGALSLASLKQIKPDLLAKLAKVVGGGLCLDGLTELDADTAAILAAYPGTLSLNGLTQISDECAAHLAKHTPVLFLDGLEEISISTARSFGKHQGVLSLSGIKCLSDEAAGAIAAHSLSLSLDGLEQLSPVGRKALEANTEIGLPESAP